MLGFIVNPVAGNGRGAVVWKRLETELKRRGAVYRVRMTSKEGEAKKLAAELLQKEEVTHIVAVGGDGTVSEVINGISESGICCPFGHVPAGSGNDFARGHNLPSDALQALERILAAGKQKRIDLLRVNGQLAVNAVGAGFDGQVAKITNEAGYKRWLNRVRLGTLSYVISMLRVLVSYQPCRVMLTVDGKQEQLENVWLIAVANIPNYGGGMLICPGAVPDDGLAEVCVVSGVSRWALLRAFPLIYRGAHVRHPAVRFFRGRHIRIQAENPLVVHADGEVADVTPVTVEVARQRQVVSL
ncbi:diacylglycerol/lipid kinase family protein [Brevibacillus thermoruber]|jgi:diacylglycerol kinase (ATP)|uniref:Diacylglycerol kinase family lipid kinase n=1 Tax=Brevibacillus thermoruber TaxID=33942 RepID=A0A9X3TRG9_9BACL|nr:MULTISPECIES: diacylglycerol kinase family protein [Brevibacillus]MDA5109446.1 diacylglycerol kinase family lipid kinase [Brevibacillus thermoruber]TRY24007.1 diacylglycerol kinase family lipid kinase [Brevibacillus sp. LEMMJ03]